MEITIGQYCLEPLCEIHAKIVPLELDKMDENLFSNIEFKNDLKVVQRLCESCDQMNEKKDGATCGNGVVCCSVVIVIFLVVIIVAILVADSES